VNFYRHQLINDVFVIVRSVGERTEHACMDLLLEVFNDFQIETIEERPFEEALRISYKLAIQKNYLWTLMIDADVLISKKGILAMLQYAYTGEYIEIQGLVYDKFFKILRPAGNHLYRTSSLDYLLSIIPENGIEIRPESYILQEASKKGLYMKQTKFIIGIHDFFQSPQDIYRKIIQHSVKHQEQTAKLFKKWSKDSDHNYDLFIACAAIKRAKSITKNLVSIDQSNKIFEFPYTLHSNKLLYDLSVRELKLMRTLLKRFDFLPLSLHSFAYMCFLIKSKI
jgi:hypothetical protein